MKAIGIGILILGILVAAVPQFTDCKAVGRPPLQLANGGTTEMKCYWTARAELALGIPMALTGLLMVFSRRKETQRNLAIVGAGLGAAAIAVPAVLIGVCASSMMICNSVMRPALILMGTVAIGLAAVSLVAERGKGEPVGAA